MLTGNPQNMLIGISSGIPFARFLVVMFPVAAVCLALVAVILLRLYRTRLPERFTEVAAPVVRVNRTVVRRMLVVLALVLAALLAPTERLVPGLSAGQKLPLVALAGGTLAILVGRYRPKRVLAQVDWPLLLFFAGLFVVIGGVARAGVLERVHEAVTPLFGTTRGEQTVAFTAFTVAGSNVVSNVPYVLVARDWMDAFADPRLMWYVLAAASTFAGNLTIVGSVANIIVLEQSRDEAPIGFIDYLRAGVPITLVTTVVGVGMLWAMAAAGLPL